MKLRLFVIIFVCLVGIFSPAKAQLKDGTYVGNIIRNNVATRGVFNLFKSNAHEYTVLLQLYSLTGKREAYAGTVRLTGSIARDGFLKFNNAVWTEVPTITERRNGTRTSYRSPVERDYSFIQQVQLREVAPGTLEGLIQRSPFSLTQDPYLSETFLNDIAKKNAAFERSAVSFVKADNEDDRCVALLKWMRLYFREFPSGEKLARGEVSKSDLLFYDTHFVPVFGKPYDELKQGEAGRIYEKIMKCYKNPLYGHEFTPWHQAILERLKALEYKSGLNIIKDYHWKDAYYTNPHRDQLIQRLAVYRLLYADYATTLNRIQTSSNTLTLEQLDGYRKSLVKFEALWPSDLQKANEVISASEGLAAQKSLKTLVLSVTQSDNSYQSLRSASEFSTKHSRILSLAGKEFADNIQVQVTTKMKTIVTELMREERKEVSKIRLGEEGIPAGNRWLEGFVSRYAAFMDLEPVNQTKEYYFKSRLRTLSLLRSALESRVAHATTASELARLKSTYLGSLPMHYELVSELSSKMDTRLDDIHRQEIEKQEQAKRERERRERLAEAKGPKISTEGLKLEKIIRSIWKGDFANIPFDRGSIELTGLVNGYIALYSNYCFSSLPSNMIELTEQVADGWETPVTIYKNRKYGFETGRVYGATTPNHWHSEGTGVYAKPELYKAKKAIALAALGSFMGGGLEGMLEVFKGGNPVGNLLDKTANALKLKKEIGTDIEQLIRRNGCKSPGLMRFEQNLSRYALEQEPIPLEGL